MRTVVFNADFNEIEIVPLADLHIGSPQCDENLIKEVCEYIEEKPNRFTILNGDLVDNNIRSSVGSVFEEVMSPMSQVTTATYYLSKIAAQKKIINMTVGNHELRSEKETGLTPSDLLLANLMKYDESLNERYCIDGAYTFLTLKARGKDNGGTSCFTIFNLHGSGSGMKAGGKVQRLDDMQSIVPANVYIRSHTHIPETHRGIMMTVDSVRHKVKEEQCLFVNTNAFLKYGGYGARNGMKPLARAIPVIRLKCVRRSHRSHGVEKDFYVKSMECTLKENLYEF